MLKRRALGLAAALVIGVGTAALAQDIDYLEPSKPYKSAPYLKELKSQKVDASKGLKVPLITWAADGVTVAANGGLAANPGSRLAKAVGKPVELKVTDDFDEQVTNYILGESPFLRGTVGMINLVGEALKEKDPGLEPVVIFQLSWSTGADGFVAKDLKTLDQLKGKTIVVQLNGPHVDLLRVLLEDAGLGPKDVTIKFVQEITFNPTAAADGLVHDPANALRKDKSLSGAACIFPDILALSSNGKVGDGTGDSVKGARPILTTRTASRVIADVYAVRKDFFEANKDIVKNFTLALLKEQKRFQGELGNIAKKGAADKAKVAAFRKECEPLSKIFLGDAGMVNDYVLWLGVDSELAGYAGNASFFNKKRNPVGFASTSKRIQEFYLEANYIEKKVELSTAGWDYKSDFGGALGESSEVVVAKKAFKSAQAVRKAADSTDSKELFKFSFKFPARMATLKWQDYQKIFETMHEKVVRYGGAVVQLRGHADIFFHNFVKMKRKSGAKTYKQRGVEKDLPTIEEVVNSASKLSYSRSFAVKRAYAQFLREALGLTTEEIDLSRFDVKGMGISDPLNANPQTKEQRHDNMRCEMVIIAAEAELDLDFDADDLK